MNIFFERYQNNDQEFVKKQAIFNQLIDAWTEEAKAFETLVDGSEKGLISFFQTSRFGELYKQLIEQVEDDPNSKDPWFIAEPFMLATHFEHQHQNFPRDRPKLDKTPDEMAILLNNFIAMRHSLRFSEHLGTPLAYTGEKHSLLTGPELREHNKHEAVVGKMADATLRSIQSLSRTLLEKEDPTNEETRKLAAIIMQTMISRACLIDEYMKYTQLRYGNKLLVSESIQSKLKMLETSLSHLLELNPYQDIGHLIQAVTSYNLNQIKPEHQDKRTLWEIAGAAQARIDGLEVDVAADTKALKDIQTGIEMASSPQTDISKFDVEDIDPLYEDFLSNKLTLDDLPKEAQEELKTHGIDSLAQNDIEGDESVNRLR